MPQKHTPKLQKKQIKPVIIPVFPREVYSAWVKQHRGTPGQIRRYLEILDWYDEQEQDKEQSSALHFGQSNFLDGHFNTLLTLEREPSAPVPAGEGVVALNADSPTFYPSEERA